MPPPNPAPTPAAAEDSDYDSAADSDFAASLSPSSGDDSDTSKTKKIARDGDIEMGSGDEGIVAQGRKKRSKKGKGKKKGDGEREEEEEEEEEGTVGVRVRLRSGRGGEESKRSNLPKSSGATIDIDSVWARLNNPQSHTVPPQSSDTTANIENIPPPASKNHPSRDLPSILKAPQALEQTITIPHTYTFAGETHTSTKTVPISSPEAQAYLARKENPTTTPSGPPLRRPLARKNLLDPNPNFLIRGREVPPRADLPTSIGGKGTRHLDTGKKTTQWNVGDKKDVKKLNTVEKSKLDWEAEVERQGMREELERAEKSGKSYMGRREFLDRVEGKGEEEARLQRLKMAGVTG